MKKLILLLLFIPLNSFSQDYKVNRIETEYSNKMGCGVDSKSYAAAYAKNFRRQAISCGVVIGGHTAINIMMN